MRFVFPHSHAFPGGRVELDDDGKSGPECLAEFGDGVTVIATCRFEGETILVDVPTYRTARGTQVAARSWLLAKGRDGVWRSRRAS